MASKYRTGYLYKSNLLALISLDVPFPQVQHSPPFSPSITTLQPTHGIDDIKKNEWYIFDTGWFKGGGQVLLHRQPLFHRRRNCKPTTTQPCHLHPVARKYHGKSCQQRGTSSLIAHHLLSPVFFLFFFVFFGNLEFRQDGVEKIKYTTACEDSPAMARS